MKLSLSCRIAESSSRKDVAALPIEELAPLAATAGFSGLSMRASAVSINTSPDRVSAIHQLLDTNGLAASMVMGNVALAANNTEAPDCLRNITPHLNLAECLGANLVRVMIQQEDESLDQFTARELRLRLKGKPNCKHLRTIPTIFVHLIHQLARPNNHKLRKRHIRNHSTMVIAKLR